MGTLFSVAGSLALVLCLLGLAMRALRRFASGALVGRGRLPLEVVQRLTLGPRQGIAVVRVGDQFLAVAMGDGGVRPLLEITGEDRERLLAPATPVAQPLPQLPQLPQSVRSFQAALRSAVRSAALVMALVLVGAPAVRAQGAGTPAAAAPAAAAPRAAQAAQAAPAPTAEQIDRMATGIAPRVDLQVGQSGAGGLRLSGTVGVVVMMGLLTLLPTLLLMMTSFTRILIVLHFLRQALGTQSAPPAHLMAGLALLLTGFVMGPTLGEANRTAFQPWINGQIEQGEMMVTAVKPFRRFMLAQTRESDLGSFMAMSRAPAAATVDDVPLVVLTSAFVTSELKTAFQIGFALFLPFIVIDLVVSSVLMSMGMMMLPPAMIALPFKLLLFVLVDGWTLIVQGLVASFR